MRQQHEEKLKAEKCDLEKIQNIVTSLDYLRSEAKRTGVEDVENIVNSAFDMMLSAYIMILRYSVRPHLLDCDGYMEEEH